MSWKTEIDRTVHEALRRAFDEKRADARRGITLANDFIGLSPSRAQSHFALGLVEETLHLRTLVRAPGGRGGRRGEAYGHDAAGEPALAATQEGTSTGNAMPADPNAVAAYGSAAPTTTEAAPPALAPFTEGSNSSPSEGSDDESRPASDESAPMPTLAESPAGEPTLWRWLGRVDVASRGGPRVRVRELAADPAMDLAVKRSLEGRLALRAVSRALLFGGDDARVYDLYSRHLAATNDEGSRRDADGLVGDAARHADDLSHDGDEAGAQAALLRALEFTAKVALEGRAGAKIQRKIGRSHQLAGRFTDAAQAYRDALGLLSPEDRYRSVLHGDLALAALEVRGTLDLLPKEGRGNVAEAEKLLSDAKGEGEGESYNAIYTLGVLAYERGDFAGASERFREADRLMRETRAKARIVHARSRFFLGACLLKLGASGEALQEAGHLITRDAAAAALDASVKEPVFELLAAADPGARIPGRMPPRGADRGERPDHGERRGRRGRGGRGRGDFAAPETGIVSGGSFDGIEVTPGIDATGGGGEPAEMGGGEDPSGAVAAEGYDDRRGRGRGRGRGRQDDRPAPSERLDRYSGRVERAPHGPHLVREPREPRPPTPRPAAAPVPASTGSAPTLAGSHLAGARRVLDSDPHAALKAVDDAFKSRPTFEEWNTAYRIRLEALIRLHEKGEAMRTYERFRAKLHERARADRLEELLIDPSSPMLEVLDDAQLKAEQVDLYASMTGRERAFVDAATALASHHAALGTPTDLRVAVSLLREAIAAGGDEARGLWTDVAMRARAAGVAVDGPPAESVRARLSERGAPARVVVVGGDEASRSQGARLEDLGRRAGFEGSLVLGGARPAQQTLADVEAAAKGAAAIVMLHTTTRDVRDGVRRIAGDLSVPVREIPYAGPASLECELLTELGSI